MNKVKIELLKKHGFVVESELGSHKWIPLEIQDVYLAADGFTVHLDPNSSIRMETYRVHHISWPSTKDLESRTKSIIVKVTSILTEYNSTLDIGPKLWVASILET